MTIMSWVVVGFLWLPLGCAGMFDYPVLKGTSMPPSVSKPAHVQKRIPLSVSDTSVAALKKKNKFLHSELISVWRTFAQTKQANTKNQEASRQDIEDLQEQVVRLQVVMQAQDESVKKAERTLQNLDRSVTRQGKILQEIGSRTARLTPSSTPASPVAVVSPKTPQPIALEETFPSALPTVNLNTVPAAGLVRGLSLTRQEAEEIIKHRPYKRIGELVSMNVIPKAMFDRIRKQLVISLPAE